MNPFYSYCVSFGLAIVFYSLDWSTLYPPLTFSLLAFLILTLLFQGVAGYLWSGRVKVPIAAFRADVRMAATITAFLYILWTFDFIHAGGVPLLMILFDTPFNYRTFGVPTLHVFTVTFASFYTILLFDQYLSTRNRWILCFFIANLLAAVLIYSRAMFLFNTSACLLLFIHRYSSHRVRLALFGLPILLLLLFLFGVMGNLRVAREANKPYASDLLVVTGSATQAFALSPIPKEFFWTYIYVTSPLANLQTNANLSPPSPLSIQNTVDLVINEFTFDFMSKRINRLLGKEAALEHRITGPFNVSTIYSRSYSYQNWWGMAFMAIFLLLLPWAYRAVLKTKSPYSATGYALLCTIFLFSAYDNTFRMTGLGFQLVYPLVFAYLHYRNWLILAPVHSEAVKTSFAG